MAASVFTPISATAGRSAASVFTPISATVGRFGVAGFHVNLRRLSTPSRSDPWCPSRALGLERPPESPENSETTRESISERAAMKSKSSVDPRPDGLRRASMHIRVYAVCT